MKDGKVYFVATTEEYKNFIKWLHGLYSEGLLDDTGFSQTADQYSAKLTSETPVVGVASVWEIGDNFATYDAYNHYAYLDPMTGLDGLCLLYTSAKYGADSLKELQDEKKIIYQSKNRLDKPGDSAFNLQASVSLPDDVKKCLGQIRGKFALGRCKDGLKNPHIFMPDAVTQDGYKRICYASVSYTHLSQSDKARP